MASTQQPERSVCSLQFRKANPKFFSGSRSSLKVTLLCDTTTFVFGTSGGNSTLSYKGDKILYFWTVKLAKLGNL